jgi:hypothetical protein
LRVLRLELYGFEVRVGLGSLEGFRIALTNSLASLSPSLLLEISRSVSFINCFDSKENIKTLKKLYDT